MTDLRVFFAVRQASASIAGVKGVSMAVEVQTESKSKTFRLRRSFK